MAGPIVDIESAPALIEYLRSAGHVGRSATPKIQTLAGGVSNKTVLVELPDGRSWVLKQALPKLRVAVDWFSDPSRIRREAEGLRHLHRLAPLGTITPLVFEDPEQYLLAMEAVPQPHENFKAMLMRGHVDPALVEQFGLLLGTIHRRASESNAPLDEIFADRSFFESLRVEPYYEYAAAQVPEAADFLHDLIRATRSIRVTLVHGDYSPKNVLVRDGRLVLLDHEVIHWGDPGFDLGFGLTHLLSKAHHFAPRGEPYLHAALTFWQAYRSATGPWNGGPTLEAGAVRHALGCLLARVAGRSPLEYLTPEERRRQRSVVTALMKKPPTTVEQLVQLFGLGAVADARH
jgi:5-methylthioribose kinase